MNTNYPSYPTNAPAYAAAPASAPTAPPSTNALALGVLAAWTSVISGGAVFLISGFRGHSAGWEMLALPTLFTMALAAAAGVAAIVAMTRKSVIGGHFTIGLAGLGVLLALVGFVLGA